MEKRFMFEALLILGGILLGAGGATVAHNINKNKTDPIVIKPPRS